VVQSARLFNAHRLGEITVRAETSLEQVFLLVVGRIDLHDFFVEPLDEVSERFIFTLKDSLQGCDRLRMSSRGGEMSAELLC
ncbi:hypothetical protein A2U01_0082843, partial [Trifolium medium]|nr:hypothetical protein [Trifolium medium]